MMARLDCDAVDPGPRDKRVRAALAQLERLAGHEMGASKASHEPLEKILARAKQYTFAREKKRREKTRLRMAKVLHQLSPEELEHRREQWRIRSNSYYRDNPDYREMRKAASAARYQATRAELSAKQVETKQSSKQ